MVATPSPPTLTLSTLVERLASHGLAARLARGRGDVQVSGIAFDSRRVVPGDLFVALRGARTDGARFVDDAVTRGCVAVASEEPERPSGTEAWIEVSDARAFLALASRELLRHGPIPALVGVTGTKGKSTTVHAIAHALGETGHPCGVLGTVAYELGSRTIEAPRTTPESTDLERYLQEMSAAGMTHCAMEASSHAIELKRTAALPFAVAVFTNLGQDHLDFHGTTEAYFAAKRRLFEALGPGATAIVNADDGVGAAIAAATRAKVVLFGRAEGAGVRILSVVESRSGIHVELEVEGATHVIDSPLLGAMNAHNLAGALGACRALGVPVADAAAGLATFGGVPGRMEAVRATGGVEPPFLCLVDYAHTPEALENALAASRSLAAGGRVIVVMGCGGDRDRSKRPLMGAAAVKDADLCIVTSDNPRSEDPLAVLLDVEVGIKKLSRENYRIVPDRREAIRAAIGEARPGDVVIIAGKGHERTQTTREGVFPFDDRDVAAEELGKRLSEKGGRR